MGHIKTIYSKTPLKGPRSCSINYFVFPQLVGAVMMQWKGVLSRSSCILFIFNGNFLLNLCVSKDHFPLQEMMYTQTSILIFD